MKRITLFGIGALCALFASNLPAQQVPPLINYQGRVVVGMSNFDGSGQFKFALVNATGTITYWSNNDSSVAGSEPTAAVALTVNKGLYAVLLGDATLLNMTAVPAAVFANSDVRLRVWFDDGTNGSQLLTPDQRIAPVGYAMMAAGVNLPSTTSASTGVLTQNGSPLIHSFGSNNFFAGKSAGNFSLTGDYNTAMGVNALSGTTTGVANSALGGFALYLNSTGGFNIATGYIALFANTTGSSNTALGTAALGRNTTGSNNIAIGDGAGYDLTDTTSNNIDIGNRGVAGDANIIRIGDATAQTDTFLTGVIHGDGSGLTGVAPAAGSITSSQLASDLTLAGTTTGTFSGNLTGNAATATSATTATSAGSFTGNLAGDVTGTQGATVVSTVGGSTAANVHAAELLANAATNANTASAIVKRDGSGNFTAGMITVGGLTDTGNIALSTTSGSTVGVITQNGSRLIHSFGTNNLFAGANAGNFVMTGTSNTASGATALQNNTTGANNIALGFGAGQSLTTGSNNIDIGNNGVAGEGNIIRIGTAGTQTDTFLTGIIHGNGSALTGLSGSNISNGSIANAGLANSSIIVTAGAGLSGGGTVALGGTITLGSNATAANTASTIVLRDGSGNFSAGTITVAGLTDTGNIALSTTSGSTVGVITQNGSSLIHSYGISNFFAGTNAGNFTMTGTSNTASGVSALYSNTTGFYNTASGAYALYSNTTGSNNTASGDDALYSNATGYNNTASGAHALRSNYNGANNIALGYNAGINLTYGSNNIDIGNEGVANEGNTIRIGTAGTQTDTYLTGVIHGDSNLSLPTTSGSNAGVITQNGNRFIHSFGSTNFFAGKNAGNFTMSGNYNTASGGNALQNNTSGNGNTASGSSALLSNTTGYYNTASGFGALQNNNTGYNNTASGFSALLVNFAGDDNTASGFSALQSNTYGFYNTASGSYALYSNTTGNYNIASGGSALFSNTTGANNVALGYNAGMNLTTGNNNIAIGNAGLSGEGNTTRIGTAGTQTRAFMAGITGVSVSGAAVIVNSSGQLGVTLSSRRFKRDIEPMGDASDVLFSLRPVKFRYKPEIDPNGIQQFGLIAEEVNEVAPDLVIRDTEGAIQTVRYEQVNAMLLNEVQKLRAKNDALESETGDLRARLEKLEALMMKEARQ